MKERERLGSRLGFLLLSAGCAIGIGNVWKFPYITGLYGGGAFVLIYLFFLVVMGIPMLTMEFSIGRASRKSPLLACKVLEKPGQKWHLQGYMAMAGNYLLMMFYTTVSGWMLHYFYLTASGTFENADVDRVEAIFGEMLSDPLVMSLWMILVVVVGFFICSRGVQAGVEKITKVMMLALFFLIVVLAVNSLMLDGGMEGLKFYLLPDFSRMAETGIGATIAAAMNQSFFTLSLGIGAMAIFGSYIGKERSLAGESLRVCLLDTFVAITAGLIIFPACFAFGVDADSGPNLIFITLPNIFNHMAGGRVWGSLFFLFMAFAAFSTVIAVFENIISCCMDLTGCSRKKAAFVNVFLMILLSLPCVLGFNLLSGFEPLGEGTSIMDLEDFLVSNITLPIGSLIYLLFCTSRYGWGWKNFLEEANTGKGLKLRNGLRFYMTYILPIIILVIFVLGIKDVLF
ncbi:MAG TPA: sodium-dependent transporter [Candidatus Acetatifactor stercoripullorum]|uniref:Transporter n=1 Tax=Candidatus Acetatifactor stercoripullorum TaxID=2838414 RepID=A0A9D1UCS9_9FIRM|nr:sodium-dependent transporter [uncultured Acetatifactor sp.]HIW81735.1 sodium-dependent transporter [Candidatus Acetatifactor stercoripullorum]